MAARLFTIPEEDVVALLSRFLSVICVETIVCVESLFPDLFVAASPSLLLVNTVFRESLDLVELWLGSVLAFLPPLPKSPTISDKVNR